MARNVKADFPFFEAHPDTVWLDSAATTQKPKCMAEALTEFYNEYNSNVSRGEYPLADGATRLYEGARETVAEWFSAPAERVVFTCNATDSLNIAAGALGERVSCGDNVIVTPLEHHSALLPWMRICEKNGAELRFIPLLPDGSLDFSALSGLTDGRTRAAVITAGSNVSGYRTPLDTVGAFFGEKKIPLIIDAAQAAAHGRIDASKLKFEYMCLSAHKLYGPTGLGVLIAGSDGALDVTGRLGGGTVVEVTRNGYVKKTGAAGLEAGTPDAAGAYAFAKTLLYLGSVGIERLWENELRLAELLRRELKSLGFETVPCGSSPLPVVSFDPKYIHPLDLARLLGSMGICVRSGRHCAHTAHEALGFSGTVRASLAIYNDESDVLKFIDALKYLKGRYCHVS